MISVVLARDLHSPIVRRQLTPVRSPRYEYEAKGATTCNVFTRTLIDMNQFSQGRSSRVSESGRFSCPFVDTA